MVPIVGIGVAVPPSSFLNLEAVQCGILQLEEGSPCGNSVAESIGTLPGDQDRDATTLLADSSRNRVVGIDDGMTTFSEVDAARLPNPGTQEVSFRFITCFQPVLDKFEAFHVEQVDTLFEPLVELAEFGTRHMTYLSPVDYGPYFRDLIAGGGE